MKSLFPRLRPQPSSMTQKSSKRKVHESSGVLAVFLASLLTSCGGPSGPVAYYLSHHPDDHKSRPLRHYPVARQGKLTAWVTSDHVRTPENWLYAPGDPVPKYPIVGRIRAESMPAAVKHDGAFLIVSGYKGPLYDLWEGTTADGRLFTGPGGWVSVWLEQKPGVNTWVYSKKKIGGWSGYPVVIGDPAKPEAVVGAMWYRHNQKQQMGGTTSSRFLKKWLGRLDFSDFVKNN